MRRSDGGEPAGISPIHSPILRWYFGIPAWYAVPMKRRAFIQFLAAAALFGIATPFSKTLLVEDEKTHENANWSSSNLGQSATQSGHP
jgi:hypothetical protein